MAEETAEAPKKKSKMKIIIPAVVLVLGLGGGGGFFVASSGKKAAAGATTTTTTIPGPVVELNAITTNLTDGHILKVGVALRLSSVPKDKKMKALVTKLTAPAAEGSSSSSSSTQSELGGEESVALDLIINVLGNDTYAALSSPEGRAAAKEDLTKKIEAAYNGDITDVYFTNFVMS